MELTGNTIPLSLKLKIAEELSVRVEGLILSCRPSLSH